MRTSSIHSRPPIGHSGSGDLITDSDVLALHLADAAHVPGGHAAALAVPDTEAGVAEILRSMPRVLAIGAQSSLTGGATPMGEVLLSTRRMNRIEHVGADHVRVQAGVTLTALDETLATGRRYYPPAPTFTGAFVGGTIATNAGGAATFKYGTTRDWVRALTVVLPDGDVLDIERGSTRASPDGFFDLELADRRVRVQIPTYRMPQVTKLSAGYFAATEMDLIDLFIGSEGTLGIVTSVTLKVLPVRPAFCLAFVPFSARDRALAFARLLRDASATTWRTNDPQGIDVSAIECMDARCLALIREDGLDRASSVAVPRDAELALLVTLELPPDMSADRAFDEIGRARGAHPPDTSLVRFCALLSDARVLDDVEIAVPGDKARAAQLLAVREGVPAAVNRRVGRAQQSVDSSIEKTAGDLLVPFHRMGEFLETCDAEFRNRRLDAAIWGHLSDGNVHPNVIPRSLADVDAGRSAILALGREAIRLGGTPLAEHGVGRNPVKQQLLRELYGQQGIDEMRRVKQAIDPAWKLAPGVLFPR